MKEKKIKIKITRADRVLRILEMLSNGEPICMEKNELIEQMKNSEKFHNLDDEFNVCIKTLQNDMVYIREYLGDNLTKTGNSYKLLKKDSLDSFFKDNHKEIKKFFHAISLIDQSVFGENFKKYAPLLDAIKEEQKDVYLFLENPFENLKNLALKSQLERCIRHGRYIDIDYYSDKEHVYKRVRAYKIIYQNGAWYLATMTTKDYEVNGGFKLLRLNFIRNITYSTKLPTNFNEDIQVKDFLENRFQSLFTSYDKKFFTVKLKVKKKVARYFEVKKYLKSQKIIERTEEYIIVELSTNDEMEIIPLVQRWLPYIKVLEPKYIHEKILKNIASYTYG